LRNDRSRTSPRCRSWWSFGREEGVRGSSQGIEDRCQISGSGGHNRRRSEGSARCSLRRAQGPQV